MIDVLPDARKEEEIFRERKQLMEDAIATFDKFDEDQGAAYIFAVCACMQARLNQASRVAAEPSWTWSDETAVAVRVCLAGKRVIIDGELDEEELDQMFTQCGITLSTPQCRQVIAYCDADRNGTVSLRELRWLLTAKENVAETLVSNKQTPTKRSTRHCGASPIKLST